MPYGLIDENDILIQKQPDPSNGFIEIPSDAVCGQIKQPDGSFIDPSITVSQESARNAINIAAGNARFKIMEAFVSPGFGTLDEYNNTALEVKKWRDAGNPVDNVPESITAWAIPKGITNEQAATELEAQEAFLRGKLDAVRTLRLAGTVATDNALSDWGDVAQPHIDALNNYDPLA